MEQLSNLINEALRRTEMPASQQAAHLVRPEMPPVVDVIMISESVVVRGEEGLLVGVWGIDPAQGRWEYGGATTPTSLWG